MAVGGQSFDHSHSTPVAVTQQRNPTTGSRLYCIFLSLATATGLKDNGLGAAAVGGEAADEAAAALGAAAVGREAADEAAATLGSAAVGARQ